MDNLSQINSLTDLLLIKDSPFLESASEAEVIAMITKLRQLSSSPPTVGAKLKEESDKTKPKGVAGKRKMLLDTL